MEKLIHLSIHRPIFVSMIVAFMMVLGILGFAKIGVDEFPKVDPPIITVTTVFPGAGPREVETLISKKIEEEVSQLSGIERMTSTSKEGISILIIEFKISKDAKEAQNEVRDKVNRAESQFPGGAEEPLVQRLDFNDRPILQFGFFNTQNKAPATEQTGTAPLQIPESRLRMIADQKIKPALQTVDGVGQIDIFGGRAREIQVNLDHGRAETWGVTPGEVATALRTANINVPSGSIQEEPTKRAIRITGEYSNLQDIGETVVKTLAGGRIIRVKDVAEVIDSFEDTESLARVNGNPAVILEIKKQSDANTVATADLIKEKAATIKASLIPEGTSFEPIYDGSRRIRLVVKDVLESLGIAALLTIVVVFFFLGSVQSTLITGLALPTSMIGSFFLLNYYGFTMNVMTLLGLTLAVGLVLDDAIVVRENIWSKMEHGMKPIDAAFEGTKEVLIAVMATSLTILAVFIPVAFLPGIVGKFFSSFALTVVICVVYSTFDAITMAPMLSAHLANPIDQNAHKNPPAWKQWVETKGTEFKNFYIRVLKWSLGHPGRVVAMAAGLFLVSLVLPKFIGFTFLPQREEGELNITLEATAGTSIQKMNLLTREVEKIASEFPEIEFTTTRVGTSTGDENVASVYVRLVPGKDRQVTTGEFKGILRARLAPLAIREDLVLAVLNVGGGAAGQKPVTIAIQGPETDTLAKVSEIIMDGGSQQVPLVVDLESSMKPGQKEVQLEISHARLSAFGLTTDMVGKAVRGFFDGDVASQYRESDEEYDIRVRLQKKDRMDIAALKELRIPNLQGKMIPLKSVTEESPGTSPTQITRIDRSRAVIIQADLAQGAALGDAIQKMTGFIQKILPAGYSVNFLGQAKSLKELGLGAAVALSLAVLFIYMIMASLYESLIIPFSILLTLPLAIIGAFSALLLFGKMLDVYTIIGIILLMGLVTKNAILLVDYAEQLRREGFTRTDALITAGERRLRPIMMTSVAMIAGFLPVAIGVGEINAERSGMGTAAIGGMISSTALSLIVVPVCYIYLDDFRSWLRSTLKGQTSA